MSTSLKIPRPKNLGVNGVVYITPFEKASLIAHRAEQLQQGAQPKIDTTNMTFDVIRIAELEIEQRVAPLSIIRGEGDDQITFPLDKAIFLDH